MCAPVLRTSTLFSSSLPLPRAPTHALQNQSRISFCPTSPLEGVNMHRQSGICRGCHWTKGDMLTFEPYLARVHDGARMNRREGEGGRVEGERDGLRSLEKWGKRKKAKKIRESETERKIGILEIPDAKFRLEISSPSSSLLRSRRSGVITHDGPLIRLSPPFALGMPDLQGAL